LVFTIFVVLVIHVSKYIVKVSCIPIYHIFIPVYSICQVHDVYVVTVVLSSFSRWLKLNRHVFCV